MPHSFADLIKKSNYDCVKYRINRKPTVKSIVNLKSFLLVDVGMMNG